ncbi:hemolysin family protein [Cytophagaceae bacterium DM2B3-1]|uniref:Hemolysin family protein n=1 Tax=Xanthocytophaga flava TaxID=3048013 RepID=A0ABT7CLM3_9BACT|nr:hemolysin family protein [Xanthocytophaga flavus]MDJ1493897.1 hemolysin family protein [Xanthocytophaga flavus]
MLLDILLTLFLVLLNGFFVAAEFAIVKVRSSRIEVLAESGSKTALMAKKIISQMDSYLSATQLGITIASLALGWVGESVVAEIVIACFDLLHIQVNPAMAHSIAVPTSFTLITILHIVFGELAPKSLAIQRSEATTLAVAYPLYGFFLVGRPIIWLLNGFANFIIRLFGIEPAAEQEVHSPEELLYLVEQGTETGLVEKTNYEIIRNAFDFSDRTARQIMVPRTQISALNIDADAEEIEKIIDEGYSRIPVYEETIDNIIGVLNIKDLLIAMRKDPQVSIRSLLRPAIFVPESKKVGDLLSDLQRQHVHLVVVLNEYGGTNGIISMEDIVEELVGDIQDEYDIETPIVENKGDNIYIVAGNTSVSDVNEFIPEALPESKEYESIGGLIISKLERLPQQEETLIIDNYKITVVQMKQNQIVQVQLEWIEEGHENDTTE